MNEPVKTGHYGLAALLACAALLLPAAVAHADTDDDAGHDREAEMVSHRFAVFYDDRRIGEHRYEIIRDGEATRVHSRADFQVKLLFISAYRYQHHANELWRDGCLTRLEAVTDDNGERHAVAAERQQGSLVLTRLAPERSKTALDAACPATFAYWDRERLQREQLINAQTGKALTSTLTRQGAERLDGVEAERYRLQADSLAPIDLWYRASDGQWLRLETRRNDGTLSYRLEETRSAPAPAIDADADVGEPPAI